MSPGTFKEFDERLKLLGVSIRDSRVAFKVGLCMNGWVLMVDDRGPTRKVSSVPPETTAAFLEHPWNGT